MIPARTYIGLILVALVGFGCVSIRTANIQADKAAKYELERSLEHSCRYIHSYIRMRIKALELWIADE